MVGLCLGSAEPIFGRDKDSQKGGGSKPDAGPINFTKATFAPYVGTVFRIFSNPSKALSTTLVSIEDIGPVPDAENVGRECFLLTFRGTETLLQNTYRIEHQALGQFELFLVPGGKNKKNVYYQAVINRLN